MRLRVSLLALVGALAAPGLAHATQTVARPGHLYRPNPVLTGIQLDYVNPLPAPDGGVAVLPPLSELVIAAAVRDEQRLTYRLLDDLGGFVAAPLGQLALSSGGRDVVGNAQREAEIPLFQHHAGGKVNAFTFTGSGPPITSVDNGKQPVPGLGQPTPVPPAGTNAPPANGGFSGPGQSGGKSSGSNGGGAGGGGGGGRNSRTSARTGTQTGRGAGTGRTATGPPPTTRPRTTTRRTTTQATISTTTPATSSTTTPTTTVPAPTTAPTTTGEGGGGGGGGGDCGGDGISITPDPSNPNGCIMKLFNAKPGNEEHEVLTITNTSDAPYTLALKVSGAHNHLWSDLEMGVWKRGTPRPSPLPPLLFWTSQYNDLVTLQPGESIPYRIEIFLPVEAGNSDQSLAAIINFNWKGH